MAVMKQPRKNSRFDPNWKPTSQSIEERLLEMGMGVRCKHCRRVREKRVMRKGHCPACIELAARKRTARLENKRLYDDSSFGVF